MRLGYDLSILRHPPAGTARYATELLGAMRAMRPGDTIVEAHGWPRRSQGGRRWRTFNLASDLGWLSLGASAKAATARVDAWFSPANVLPLALPRPMIVTIHDANVLEGAGYDRAYATYARVVHAQSGRRAAIVVADSEFTRDRLIEAYALDPERIVVAYPGIDHLPPAVAKASPTARARYVLFVGQTEPHKNLVRLVAAWSEVPSDADLVIAGPRGRGEADLQAAIAASPVAARIQRVGRVSDDSLVRLYDGASGFIFPSLTEGFGLPPLEAMRHGIPTAVADATCLPEVTAGAALTFDPLDPKAIADAVRRIMDDGALRDRLIADGPRIAGRYRWADTARTVWDAIERAIGGQP